MAHTSVSLKVVSFWWRQRASRGECLSLCLVGSWPLPIPLSRRILVPANTSVSWDLGPCQYLCLMGSWSLPVPLSRGILVPASTSVSWDLGAFKYLCLVGSWCLPVPLSRGILVPASTSFSWDLGACQYLFQNNSVLIKPSLTAKITFLFGFE